MRYVALLALLLLAGCAAYSAVEPNHPASISGLTVEPHIPWSKVARLTPDSLLYDTSGRMQAWTIDGERLDAVYFFAGIADGQTLLTPSNDKIHLSPFHSNMSAEDIMDLFDSMLTVMTGSAVARSHDLRPAKLAGSDGFRFEINFTLKDDVDRELSAVGTVHGGKLYLIAFEGTKLYHYGKYLPAFDQIVASAHFP